MSNQNSYSQPISYRFAWVSCAKWPKGVPDEQEVLIQMRAQGWEVEVVDWRSSQDWDRFDLVLIRTPWDYVEYYEEFKSWLQSLPSGKVVNSVPLMLWNLDKKYLQELTSLGIPTVPSEFYQSKNQLTDSYSILKQKYGNTWVIKPSVSAASRNTFRIQSEEEWKRALKCFAEIEAFILQPFVQSIQSEGEHSYVFIGGSFSHAILKVPAQNDFRVQSQFGGRETPYLPQRAELELGQKIFNSLVLFSQNQFSTVPFYLRIDLVRLENSLCVNELELVEPNLFFNYNSLANKKWIESLLKLMIHK